MHHLHKLQGINLSGFQPSLRADAGTNPLATLCVAVEVFGLNLWHSRKVWDHQEWELFTVFIGPDANAVCILLSLSFPEATLGFPLPLSMHAGSFLGSFIR